MSHRYRFPIKGSYYYSADQAFKQELLTVGSTLYLHPEPDNEHDCHALQVWTHPNAQGYLIGYVPRQLAKQWHPILADTNQNSNRHANFHNGSLPIQLCVALARGKQMRLECQIQLNITWLKHLQTLSWSHWLRQQQTLKWWLNARRKKRHRH